MKKILLYITFAIMSIQISAQDSIAAKVENINFSPGREITKIIADSAYASGDYTSAISIYEAILRDKGESSEIYYNLGNAYYRNNDIAKAILNYERARLLAPDDNDIQFNLSLAQSKIVDKVSERYQIFFINWLHAIINIFGMNTWAIIGIVAFLLLLAGVGMFLFNNRIILRKIGFATAIAMLLLTLFANFSAWHHYDNLTNRTEAIIIAPSVTAKSTPSESGTNLFVIHEGRKVNITDDSMNAWKEIELEDGTIGWIPAETLERI